MFKTTLKTTGNTTTCTVSGPGAWDRSTANFSQAVRVENDNVEFIMICLILAYSFKHVSKNRQGAATVEWRGNTYAVVWKIALDSTGSDEIYFEHTRV